VVQLLYGILISVAAGLATGLGAIPILLFKKIPDKLHDALLGFAAGIMLTAASLSLLLPALEEGGLIQTIIGIIVAGGFIFWIERKIPHLHPHFGKKPPDEIGLEKGLLMAVAVTLHNFPEGLAVGVGLASGSEKLGVMLAVAIAAQNVPEGLAVAAPIAHSGVSKWKIFGLTLLSGLAEPVAAVVGMTVAGFSEMVLPFGLAFAAGAMIYVVSDQLIPECHSGGNETEATFGVMAGLIAMIVLQELIG
jgi:ZIP family zinc transporter